MFSRDASSADLIRTRVQPLAETKESSDEKMPNRSLRIWSQTHPLSEENRVHNQIIKSMLYRDQSDSSILSASSLSSDISNLSGLSSIELFRKPVNLFPEKKMEGFFNEKEKTYIKTSEMIKNQKKSEKKDFKREASKTSIDFDSMLNSFKELIPKSDEKNQKEKKKMFNGVKNRVLPPLKSKIPIKKTQEAIKKAQNLLLVRDSTKIIKYGNESADHGSELSIVLPSSTRIPSLQNGDQKEKSMLTVKF